MLKHQIPAHGLTPNTSIQNKPLFIYKSAFASSVSASDIEGHLSSIGVVSPQWRYSMFTTSHFHVCFALSCRGCFPFRNIAQQASEANVFRQHRMKCWA